MKRCARCREYKPLDTFHPRRDRPGQYLAYCKPCLCIREQERYRNNSEYRTKKIALAIEHTRKRRERPEVREQERIYARKAKRKLCSTPEGREHHNALGRKWRQENPDYREHFKHEHPAMKRLRASNRRARLLQATPPWVDLDAIEAIYIEADRISRDTGIPYEVDHYYPLNGKNSCGLHVPWNLRIITADANRRKSNNLPTEAGFSLEYI